MTATQVKAKLLALLDDVQSGEVIEITRHGLTVARLTVARGPHALRGQLAGVAMTAASDEHLYTTSETWDVE